MIKCTSGAPASASFRNRFSCCRGGAPCSWCGAPIGPQPTLAPSKGPYLLHKLLNHPIPNDKWLLSGVLPSGGLLVALWWSAGGLLVASWWSPGELLVRGGPGVATY